MERRSDARIRLAEQAIAAHRARLASAANKDQVRRQIRAMEDRLRVLRAAAGAGESS